MSSHFPNLVENSKIGYPARKKLESLQCWPYSLCLTGKLEDVGQSPNVFRYRRVGDCVNTVRWNDDGTFLVSGGDNLQLSIWSGISHKLAANFPSPHTNNIFDAKFVPNTSDSKIVSCAADGRVYLLDINSPYNHVKTVDTQNSNFTELCSFDDMAVKIQFLPLDSNVFLTTAQSGEVALIDIRAPQDYKMIYSISGRCYGVAFDPFVPTQFALSSSSASVGLYDLRMVSNSNCFTENNGVVAKFCHEGKKEVKKIVKQKHKIYWKICKDI